jgi:hypothetical protein
VRRWPLARATAKSAVCLVLAFALIGIHPLLDPDGPGRHPYAAWATPTYLLSLALIITAFGILAAGAATAVEQRQARRKPPPQPRLPACG